MAVGLITGRCNIPESAGRRHARSGGRSARPTIERPSRSHKPNSRARQAQDVVGEFTILGDDAALRLVTAAGLAGRWGDMSPLVDEAIAGVNGILRHQTGVTAPTICRASLVVEQTELLPAALRDAAVAAVENLDLGVASAAPTVDGSGLTITLKDEPGTSVEALSMTVDLEAALGLPVEVAAEEAPVAYNRQADRDGIGGARTYRFEAPRIPNGCTTGFAVRNGAQQGLMFAAHCGAVGNQMVVWPGNSGSSVFALAGDGVISQRYAPADGAIIRANTTIPAIYTGAWNNNTGILVSGWRTVPVGTEMCFSGSYSGFVCGNVVTQTGVTYRLDAASGGAFTVDFGVRSEQATGVPSAGQGDSGGPSVVPVLIDGQARIMAGSIISAGAPSGKECLGDVPNRICGSSVLTTPVGTILSNTGWSIATR